MYRLKSNVALDTLRQYGFKSGREWPESDRFICNESEREDFWLIPMNPDEPERPYFADEEFDQTLWSIHVQPAGLLFGEPLHHRLWIDCVPASTYHIDNQDMEAMFYALYRMICDGIIEDNYSEEESNE